MKTPSGRERLRALALLLGAILGAQMLAPAALAQGDDQEGRRRWKRGQDLYAQQKYLEAAREFEAGYEATPRPLFLLNIGHAYRRAGELAKAKDAYQRLLERDPGFPKRPEVEGYIKSIDDALHAGDATGNEGTAPGNGPEDLGQSPAAIAAALVDPSPSLDARAPPDDPNPVVTARPARRQRDADQAGSDSLLKKPWFWVIVGGVVVGGVAAALVAMQRPGDPCRADVCFREP